MGNSYDSSVVSHGAETITLVLQVYAGGTEFSFEELRAIEYLKCNRPTRCKQGESINTHSDTVITFYCRKGSNPSSFHLN